MDPRLVLYPADPTQPGPISPNHKFQVRHTPHQIKMVTRFPVLRHHVDIPPRPASHPPSASSRCHHLTSLFFPPSLVPTMWRSSSLSPSRFRLLRSTLAAFTDRSVKLTTNTTTATASAFSPRHRLLSSILPDGVEGKDPVTLAEAKRMMRLMNVESLKRKLEMGGEEVIGYQDLLKACEGMGLARNADEARIFAKVLDEAGVVLLFRDKVYLHPDKVVDLIKKAVPLALSPEDDPRREEYKELQKKKEDIDMLAHRQVRRILWSGLGFFICQVGLFFRLTFWEFSWDVMEPITFFTTTTGLVVGYGYFLFTSRDPTYQDLMMRLFLSRQRKLFQKQKFDIDRFLELQKQCKCPLDRT